jgi:hypothetical protein
MLLRLPSILFNSVLRAHFCKIENKIERQHTNDSRRRKEWVEVDVFKKSIINVNIYQEHT